MGKRKTPLPLLSPKNDFVFKQIFGDARHTRPLESFLQATLGFQPEEFAELAIVDPNLNPEHEDDKHSILDVRVKLRSGKEVDVEIQAHAMPDMHNRLQYYTARLVSGQMQSGEDYSVLPQSITIAITDFGMWPGKGRYHHRFYLYDPDAELPYPNSLEIHTLELPKLPKDGDGSKLWEWLRFISSKTRDEFEALAGKDDAMAEAYGRLVVLSEDEKERLRALAREKFARDHANRMRGAREEGLAKGLKKGRAEGRAEGRAAGRAEIQEKVAREMLALQLPLDVIAKATELSEAEITRLGKRRRKQKETVS